jgi:hypothetical protein
MQVDAWLLSGFEGSDGLQNVTECLIAVQLLRPGVYVAMHNRVYPVHSVRKDHKLGTFRRGGRAGEVVAVLVSLVSVPGRNWCYLCERVEGVEKGEIVEMANIYAVFMQVAENMIGCRKRLGEYPATLT